MSSFAKSVATALFGSLVGRYKTMLELEFDRAKVEARAKLKQIGIGGAFLAAAYLLGFCALPLLLAAAVAGLSLVWPLWLSALVIGCVVLIVMAILTMVGTAKVKKNADLLPSESIENVRRMFNWE